MLKLAAGLFVFTRGVATIPASAYVTTGLARLRFARHRKLRQPETLSRDVVAADGLFGASGVGSAAESGGGCRTSCRRSADCQRHRR